MANITKINKTKLLMIISIIAIIIFAIFLATNNKTYAFESIANNIQLNPDWIKYSQKSDEEKEEYSIVPEKIVKLYNETEQKEQNILSKIFASEPNYPEYYNLKDENLITGLKNQGSTGLCWAFAAINSVESNILKKEITTFDKPLTFSERQLDYATGPANYIKERYNPYHEKARNSLGVGGYSYTAYEAFEAGISPVSEEIFGAFNNDVSTIKNISDVLNINNVEYSVDSFENIGTVNTSVSAENRNAWVNAIKKHILNYGALSVNTIGPHASYAGSCLYVDSDSNYLINDDGNCNPTYTENGHAMSIIGWDDNFTYNYCKKYNTTTSDLTSCTNIISGTGAFILKNSWGNNTAYPYLAYASNAIGVMGVTSVSEKNWDNNYDRNNSLNKYNYFSNLSDNKYYASNNYQELMEDTKEDILTSHIFTKNQIKNNTNYLATTSNENYISYGRNSKVSEQINRISFVNGYTNTNYEVFVANDLNSFQKVGEINPDYLGVVSVNVNNYTLNNNRFYVKVISSKEEVTDINVFTKYVNNNNTISATTLTSNSNEEIYYTVLSDSFYLRTNTTNIDTGEYLYYKFLDKNNNDITSLFNITNNVVLNNLVSPTIISIGDILPAGKIKIETYYGNNLLDTSYIEITDIENLWQAGDGSRNNPYVIYNAEDYMKIYTDNIYLTANYKLGNSIDLSNVNDFDTITNNKIFYGTFNGDNHVIYGLNSSNALFNKIDTAIIGNLVLNGFNINNKNENIGLIANESENSMFQNIIIIDNNNLNLTNNNNAVVNIGNIVGYDLSSIFYGIANYANNNQTKTGYMGGLIGKCDSCKIIESYNYGNITGSNITGGFVGFMNIDYDNVENTPYIYNSYNRGNISASEYSGGFAGVLGNSYIINSYNINEKINQTGYYGNIAGYGAYSYLSNVYYLSNNASVEGLNNSMSHNNVIQYNETQLQNKNNYLNFDFNDVWEFDSSNTTITGYEYPYLKYNYFVKTTSVNPINKISIILNGTKKLTTNDITISPDTTTIKDFKYSNYDSSIISVTNAGLIKGLKDGTTNITITTLDGTNISKAIEIEVYKDIVDLSNYELIEDNYLKVNSLMSIAEMLEKITKKNDSVTFNIVGNSNRISTGNKINIYFDNVLHDSYYISVLGDVTGTGTINVSDVAKLFQYVQGVKGMDRVYQIAADVKHDNELKINDVAKLFQYVQGKRERLDD